MTTSEPRRGVRLRWGGATDVGQLRSMNQDSMLLGPDVFVVADGMGGHQGGEIASQMAIRVMGDGLRGDGMAELVDAVHEANEAVFQRSGEDPALTGMGTTLVALELVVEDGEERIAIANVGDSRAYRLSGGSLDQVSEDHSLVGEMVRDGRLTREEAQHHPQKNIVTRAIGIDETVAVDEFQILPRTGDRYLLCSDGLTDEVSERDIAVVLRTIDDPDEAARELVRRANESGGRDNITIVIVDVVDDGGLSAAASAGVPDDIESRSDDTEAVLAVPDDQAHVQRGSGRPKTNGASATGAPAKKPRAVTPRSIAFVVVVLALLGVGAFLVHNYARNTFHVGIEDDEVVIYRGRPGGVLWFEPTLVETTGIDADEVPASLRDDLEEGADRPSLTSARRYVANLAERIERLTPPVTTTTTTTTTIPATPPAPTPTQTTTASG